MELLTRSTLKTIKSIAALPKHNRENLLKVVVIYEKLKNRKLNPEGRFDKAGRWYPNSRESCLCCEHIRTPSRCYPLSINKHCRSAEHVSNRFNVDKKTLTAAYNAFSKLDTEFDYEYMASLIEKVCLSLECNITSFDYENNVLVM